ncbi:MAG: GGDEF domain-containing protein [Oleispira sp.]|nr:GGDEF domain-containing protein [Oleispira sp.]MBL4880847.1 GGDEF domain-containing protein [Oleispira sp.]
MSQQGDNSSKSTNKWRDKYLDLIERHELLEKSSKSSHDQMRRALVMVSLLADGQAENIDAPLSKLRESIKPQNDNKGLEGILQTLQIEVNRFEQQWKIKADLLLDDIQKAAKNLLLLPCDIQQKKQIAKVQKQTKEALKNWTGHAKQLQSWAQIISSLPINDILETSAAKKDLAEGADAEKSGGFFSRLFQRDESVPAAKALASQVDDHSQDIDAEPSPPQPGYNHIEQEISAMLSNLLQQLVIPERFRQRLEALKKKLTDKLNWYELVPLLEQVANLIIDALGDGQEEFEQFLQGLDQRLETIQQLVNDASQGQLDRGKARDAFESVLEDEVDEVRSIINSKTDLGELGHSISQHLGLIMSAMQEYRLEENSRETVLTKQLADMQHKLNEMEKLAEVAQHAIEEQRKKAMHDALTGLPNREAYQQRLEQEVNRQQRYGNKLSLMVCDIDLFKRINDNYGHLAGDKVLKIIAKSLQVNLRDSDFIARFGGEEFVALMPETSREEAKIVAEKLRKKIENSPFNFKKERVQITISFGISEFTEGDSANDVFERADKALYKAKENGRNQVLIG